MYDNEEVIKLIKNIKEKQNLNYGEIAKKINFSEKYIYEIISNRCSASARVKTRLEILNNTKIKYDILSFGKKLRYAREKNNLSIVELSKLTGISQMHLGRLERGITRNITDNTKIKLEKALNIKIVLDICM
ncbi:multiprotein-bridging factor 1 family protein [Clostridium sp. M14]|uniref:helix-turn-helix domain-containing protein n=1 Tax=Clostridium sp. M14 TaxID=2716311 RepID=UPI0013EE75D2|nr:helix-turn-helix transcriptional regulator [Clostridium sp. M14]MBZ9693374.1 helix-turn-helix domain-containing protein [Clostridium sp. M14]